MSYKSLQLFPQSTRDTNFRISIHFPSSSPDYGEVEFLRSSWLICDSAWLICDPELDAPRRSLWGLILGMTIALGVSASFWGGVGLAIAHLWK